jgi:Transglycosylase SLT domain
MRIAPGLTLPIVVSVASLVVGVVVGPPIHRTQLGAQALAAAQGPVDGGGPVDLSLPWDQPVAPASTPSAGSSVVGLTNPVLGPDGIVASTPGGIAVAPAVVVTGSASGIPSNVLVAYQSAAQAIASSDPTCHLPWPVLGGIGKVESGHARGGDLDSSGRTVSPILGPVLSGGPGVAAIQDSDGGRWDGDKVWDRAVGPMQFIPSSWRAHEVDGNGDGNDDPSNIYDSTLAAAGYLCTGGRDLSRPADLRQAVFGYNHSQAYVDTVLAWAQAYGGGGTVAVAPVSDAPGSVVLASGRGSSGGSGGTSGTGNGGHGPKRPRGTTSATPSSAAVTTLPPAPNLAPSVTAQTDSSESASAEPSTSDSPTDLPTPSETGCPSSTPTPTDTVSPTGTVSPTVTLTPTPTPTPIPTDPTATLSPTASPTPTPTDPCATPTPSPTDTVPVLPVTPTPTASVTPLVTPSLTPTP